MNLRKLFTTMLPLCGIVVLLQGALLAQDDGTWARFRGNDGKNTSEATPPVEWTEDGNYIWRTTLPGKGWSSPVHANGRAWMTCAVTTAATPEEIKEKLRGRQFAQIKTAVASVVFHALCVDLETGELIHNIELGTNNDPEPINPMNSYASPTPTIADGRVVCHFGSYGTWCLNEESGEKIWDQKFVVDHSVGPGSSPVVVGNHVLIVCDGIDEQYVTSVDLSTGEPQWKTERPPIRAENGEFRKAYCTPLIAEVNGNPTAVITGAQWICGYNVESGEELWRFDYGDGFSNSAMPAIAGDLIVCNTGYMEHRFVAFEVDGTGELEKSSVEWEGRNGPSMSSMVIRDGEIYSIDDTGIVRAVNAESGEELAKNRVLANVSASPLLAGGNLYIVNREGRMVVISCDQEMKRLFDFNFGSAILATPCVYGNDLIVRTETELIRIGTK